jgi:hypothetical protein
MNILVVEISSLLLRTDVLTRVATLGLEQALLSTVIELSMNRLEAVRRKISDFGNLFGGSHKD